jgi:hypothetical protein
MPRVRHINLRAALVLLGLATVLALASAQSSSAASGKLVIKSPANGADISGKQPIRARLSVGKKSRVIRARFYFQGNLLATDEQAPFTVGRSTVLDTTPLPVGLNKLKFKVVFSVRRRGGKIVKKTRRRKVSVHVFRPQSLPPGNWKQIFNDDFTNPAASQANWIAQRDDWIKNDIPYSNLEGAGYLTSNVGIANGTLNLSTSTRPAGGYAQSTGSANTNKRFAFKFGYIEARILVPACAGCWPAFWMLPSADHWPPELDVIEFFDTSKQVIPYSAVHWPVAGAKKEELFTQRLQTSDFDNYVGTWHTYGMLWTSTNVQFFVDGFAGPQFTDASKIPQLAMYPIVQLGVGANTRPPAGSTMQVDYVRAWQRAD